jgi:hypothetical protein
LSFSIFFYIFIIFNMHSMVCVICTYNVFKLCTESSTVGLRILSIVFVTFIVYLLIWCQNLSNTCVFPTVIFIIFNVYILLFVTTPKWISIFLPGNTSFKIVRKSLSLSSKISKNVVVTAWFINYSPNKGNFLGCLFTAPRDATSINPISTAQSEN